jgi:hypothetical protein
LKLSRLDGARGPTWGTEERRAVPACVRMPLVLLVLPSVLALAACSCSGLSPE